MDIDPDTAQRLVDARRDAAADRQQASRDRRAGAAERDQAELDRDTAWADRDAGADARGLAELDRDTALADRDIALADRDAGAERRRLAEVDRDTSLADRGASAREREHAAADDLTGVYLRGPGFVELERDIARARRSQLPLTLAFVDVDRLKAVNDTSGHAAGDQLLALVATTLGHVLRPYDLVIRYGGDEFVCALLGVDEADAVTRLASLNVTLAAAPEPASVTVGLAVLQPDDTLEDLIARADAELYRQRSRARGTPPA